MQNLFAEGNDLFREKDYKQALVQYMEGLNVADYAASDQVALPRELLCKLYVNRAACYFTMGLYEKALEDSEKALGLDGESIRALFRKARALNELGRHKEAYECSSRCSLALPHVSAVSQASVLALPWYANTSSVLGILLCCRRTGILMRYWQESQGDIKRHCQCPWWQG